MVSADNTITYTYDSDGHLLSESHDVGSNGSDSSDWSQTYTYDLNGNRLETDKSIYNGELTDTATFIYNAENQLTEQDGWALGNEGPDVTTFTYNPDGTLKEEDVNPGEENKGEVPDSSTTYTYDLRGRQIEEYTPANIAVGTNAVTIDSAYDTSGNRIMEGSAYFLIDDNNPTGYSQVLEERDGSATAGLARSYVIGSDVLGQTIGNPAASEAIGYLLYDGNGSIRQVVDSSSLVQSSWSYDSFGNITGGYNQSLYIGSGRGRTYVGPASDLGFQGGYANPDGSINFRARDYDPVTGRFENQDSMTFSPGDVANSDLYLFVNDDPRNGRDPGGHFGLDDILVSAGIDSMLSSLEFTGFSAVFKTVQGVENGESANQIFESFLIDQAMQVGVMIGLSALGNLVGNLADGGLAATLKQETGNTAAQEMTIGESEVANSFSNLGRGFAEGNAAALNEFPSGSAFSGVFNPESDRFLAYPSGETLMADGSVPANLVPRRAGHGMVNDIFSDLIGVDPTTNLGFTLFKQSDGTFAIEWLSGSVNGANPSFEGNVVPESMRPQVINAIESATGCTVITGS